MGKKPIVSVTYENERISIKNSSPYIKCVLRLSCVVHAWWADLWYSKRFSLYIKVNHRRDVTRILCKVSCFFVEILSFSLVTETIGFFLHTNPYISNVMQQCRWSPMLIFRAWATCGLNNKFSWYERGILLIDVVDVFRLSFQGVIITGEEKYKSKEKRRERKKFCRLHFHVCA